jgi:hypothetical protein
MHFARVTTGSDLQPGKAESNGVGGSGGHFSKSARSGSPPVISAKVLGYD